MAGCYGYWSEHGNLCSIGILKTGKEYGPNELIAHYCSKTMNLATVDNGTKFLNQASYQRPFLCPL